MFSEPNCLLTLRPSSGFRKEKSAWAAASEWLALRSTFMSPELTEHFRKPRNVGTLPAPAITVEVSSPVCGDILKLSALVKEGRIQDSRYKVRGCAASVGTGSVLTQLIAGRDKAFLETLNVADVEQAVGGLSNASKHTAVLCIDRYVRYWLSFRRRRSSAIRATVTQRNQRLKLQTAFAPQLDPRPSIPSAWQSLRCG